MPFKRRFKDKYAGQFARTHLLSELCSTCYLTFCKVLIVCYVFFCLVFMLFYSSWICVSDNIFEDHGSTVFELVHLVKSWLLLLWSGPQWFRTAKNRDVSTGPLVCSLVGSHHSLVRLLHTARCARARSFVGSLAHWVPSLWESNSLNVSKRPGFVPLSWIAA